MKTWWKSKSEDDKEEFTSTIGIIIVVIFGSWAAWVVMENDRKWIKENCRDTGKYTIVSGYTESIYECKKIRPKKY